MRTVCMLQFPIYAIYTKGGNCKVLLKMFKITTIVVAAATTTQTLES